MTDRPLELEPRVAPRPHVVPPGGARSGRALPALIGPRVRSFARHLVRGDEADPAWVRPALLGIAGLAAVLYLWDLTVSGYANEYYAAAALAGSKSWAAWFFGSLDAGNFITVDKPPLALWVMGLSVRLFGLSSWTILLPQALAGIATVVLLFFAVRRSFGPVAGLVAALVTALTPAAVLMFRFDNPDAILTLLLVVAAWAFVRALEDGATRWVVAAAAVVGCAFLTKYLQAYLVLPAFAITWAVAAPGTAMRRLEQLVAAAVTVTLASLWWVLAVEVIPTSMRPYIGGSANDSVLNLLFGYDGLGRILGGLGGPGPGGGAGFNGGGPGGGFAGPSGPLRLFDDQFAGQIAWLLPLAVAGLAGGLWVTRRAPRTDRKRAGYLMWGLWFGVHALVFSFMSGIVHTYYVVAMAPAIGALVGGGIVDLWSLRSRSVVGGLALSAALLATAAVGASILARTPAFAPGLATAIVVVAALGAVLVAIPAASSRRTVSLIATGAALVAVLAGPASYAFATVGTAYGGGDPRAGPATAGDGFGRPGGFGAPSGFGAGGFDAGGGASGGISGLPGSDLRAVGTALTDYLLANRGDARWIVAVDSANQAAPIELASGEPVMAMGGFSGSDPAPTLEELQGYIRSGELRFVLLGGRDGGFGGSFGGFGEPFGGPSGGLGGTPLGGAPLGGGAFPGGPFAAPSFGGFPGGAFGGTSASRSSWVAANCSVVDVAGTGSSGLYDCGALALT